MLTRIVVGLIPFGVLLVACLEDGLALLAWLENDLPDEEAQLLNTHVADCDEFREKLALMNAVQDVGGIGQ